MRLKESLETETKPSEFPSEGKVTKEHSERTNRIKIKKSGTENHLQRFNQES